MNWSEASLDSRHRRTVAYEDDGPSSRKVCRSGVLAWLFSAGPRAHGVLRSGMMSGLRTGMAGRAASGVASRATMVTGCWQVGAVPCRGGLQRVAFGGHLAGSSGAMGRFGRRRKFRQHRRWWGRSPAQAAGSCLVPFLSALPVGVSPAGGRAVDLPGGPWGFECLLAVGAGSLFEEFCAVACDGPALSRAVDAPGTDVGGELVFADGTDPLDRRVLAVGLAAGG